MSLCGHLAERTGVSVYNIHFSEMRCSLLSTAAPFPQGEHGVGLAGRQPMYFTSCPLFLCPLLFADLPPSTLCHGVIIILKPGQLGAHQCGVVVCQGPPLWEYIYAPQSRKEVTRGETLKEEREREGTRVHATLAWKQGVSARRTKPDKGGEHRQKAAEGGNQ